MYGSDVVYYAQGTPTPQNTGQMTTSAKVVNLSRPGESMVHNYQTISPQPTPQGYSSDNRVVYNYTNQGSNEPGYMNAQRSGQPQVYTIGANQSQNWQQPQQYRVTTTPGQNRVVQMGNYKTGGMPAQPMSNLNYTNLQYQTQPYQQQPQQQYYQSQAAPQPQSQVYRPQQQLQYQQQQQQHQPQQFFSMQSHPANQQPGQLAYTRPSGQNYGSAYQNQNGANAVNRSTTNQYTTTGQPMANQNYYQSGGMQPTSVGPNQTIRYPVNQAQNQQVYYQQQQQQQQQHQQEVQTQQHHQPQQVYQAQSDVQSKPSQVAQQNYAATPTMVQNNTMNTQMTKPIQSEEVQAKPVKVRTLPMRNSTSVDNINSSGPPQFVVHPAQQITVQEGESINLTTRVRPAGDSSLKVEWYKNGIPLLAASRFTTTFDRGYAVLNFLYTNEDDSGDYSCVATNSQGQDQSGSCVITILPEEKVVTETQLPEESMIANLASLEENLIQNGLNRSSRYYDDARPVVAPSFMKELLPQVNLKETAPAHFETFVNPANDPNLTVEWFKDGKPVSMGCRFNAILDRGFALLDIHYCYPEDNGSYYCVAKNSVGQTQSNVVELQCIAEAGIITNSVLSKESVNYLQSLDAWNSEEMAGYDTIKHEEEELLSAPTFDIQPVPLTVTEGSPARFIVKTNGYPRPKVQWFLNGDLMASHGGGGNWRIYKDGTISCLEFHRVNLIGEISIRAMAINASGNAVADTVLIVEPHQDFRPELRHVQPENTFKKLAQLKKVECSNELSKAFRKPKAQALDLRRLERELESKGRLAAEADVVETESMYSRIQSQLKTNRISSLPPSPHPNRTEMAGPIQSVQPSVKPQQPMQQQPIRPQQPMQQQPMRPQQPMQQQPISPQQLMQQQPMRPQQPMQQQPMRPQQPMQQQPMRPQQPMQQQPVVIQQQPTPQPMQQPVVISAPQMQAQAIQPGTIMNVPPPIEQIKTQPPPPPPMLKTAQQIEQQPESNPGQ